MSSLLWALAVACAGAVAMALSLPSANLSWAAPLGATALFWAWFGLPYKRAFLVGWIAGTAYFSIAFSWFGETAGKLIAPFGFFLTLGPAVGDAFFNFALPALAVVFASSRLKREYAPAAAAAALAFAEWLRSTGLGPLSVPFAVLSYGQVEAPMGPLAAYVGAFGLSFAIFLPSAYVAMALRARRIRSLTRLAAGVVVGVVACTALAWVFWPALHAKPRNLRVAAVQGNIAQSTKWTQSAFTLALDRYVGMTETLRARHPNIVVWPETVITTTLNDEPELERRFADIAHRLHAELVVGTLQRRGDTTYNALYFFGPARTIDAVYRKRALVPFAESLPFAPLLGHLPVTSLISRFGVGDENGVVDVAGTHFAPLICWESAFSDLATGDAQGGARALLIATDDAWFGTTAGPYQHYQIAQMRALETGMWIVRAASTGISGIIAPTGRSVRQTRVGETKVLFGTIGAPAPAPYAQFGSPPVAVAFCALYGACFALGRRRR